MPWRNREGIPVEDRMRDLEKTLSLDNLVGTEILTDFPEATQETGIFIIDNGGTRYLQLNAKGERWRVALTNF